MTKEFLEKNYCSKNCDELTQKECHEGIRIRCFDFEEREKLLEDFAEPKLVNGYTYEQLLETIENAKKTVTKEITKLQQENNHLVQQIEELQKNNSNLIDEFTKKADTNHSLVEQMAKLEEENAELKRRLDNLFNSDCWASEKLTKAKEIIKELVRVEYADFTNGNYTNELSKVLEQAEQFLKEIEK